MRRSLRTFLLSASALLLGWGLLGFASGIAQESQAPEEEASQEQEAGKSADPQSGEVDYSSGERSKQQRERRDLLPGSTPPPTDLKWVRDHWTPWSPPDPESFQSDAVLHILVRGDTLWYLAELSFGE